MPQQSGNPGSLMNPFLSIARRLTRSLAASGLISPLSAARLLHRIQIGRWPDLMNPADLNEKIMRLEFFTDTSDWTLLADKFEVRKFVESRGLGHILVPLFGLWDKADQIDFNSLPDQFALKATNGYAQVILVRKKDLENIDALRRRAAKWARKSFGKAGAEPHYARIRHRLIAEELLSPTSRPNSLNPHAPAEMLVDYKFLCFDGKPLYCLICSRRDPVTFHPLLSVYSLPEWKKIDAIIPRDAEPENIPAPKALGEMISCASVLSKGFPFVRVDLYDIDGKVYFGEMTFTPAAARIDYFKPDFLLHLGSLVNLPL